MSKNTNRGEEIRELIRNGYSNPEITQMIGCADSLVSYYRKRTVYKGRTPSERSISANKKRMKIYIEKWIAGEVSGGKANGYGTVSQYVRKYLFEKYNNKCAECGWSEINPYTNTIPLEVEHIDGNPENHVEGNLILLCPNCHSLTRGHSTKKRNGRRYYREYYSGKRSDG